MAHYILSEDQANAILDAIDTMQLLIDLSNAAYPAKTVQIDPSGLTAFLSSIQKKLPTDKQMPFISG